MTLFQPGEEEAGRVQGTIVNILYYMIPVPDTTVL
jgi:hypothetical protein